MSNTNRFNVGDVVEHKASGQKGVIVHIREVCVNPGHSMGCPINTKAHCEMIFIDRYDLSVGFGSKTVPVLGLELK